MRSVELLQSFDPVNSVSDLVMCGSEAASKAEAVEESKLYDRFPPIFVLCMPVKSKGKILQNFMAFSEYMNFN